jgi:hypothetical protein
MKLIIKFIILFSLLNTTLNAQEINAAFYEKTDQFLKEQVKNGLLDYANLKNNADLLALISIIEKADLSNTSGNEKKAFYINAYNLHVINKAANAYPINSVQTVNGFFDKKNITVAGEKTSLNELENDKLLKNYRDGRLHFVLVCGAIGCPPITNFAYRADQLEQQLDQQTQLALDDKNFLKITGNQLELSQIFKWYPNDFGGNKQAIIKFINTFRSYRVPTTAKIKYYDYNWALNEVKEKTNPIVTSTEGGGNNTARYIVSSTIKKGASEIKIFNNLYTQSTRSNGELTDRSTFFTSTVSYLYGLNNRFNIGFFSRYRRVRNDKLPSSPFKVLGSGDANNSRQGLTAFGPQIRYAPVEKWENFSIQSAFLFAIGSELAGNGTQPYIDWNGPTWNTQFFNDFTIGNNFSLFTEFDILLEDIGNSSEGHVNRFSTPATLILSYNPNKKLILYTLGGFSPYWQDVFDYFIQVGVGAKYQFTPNVELEFLYTDFSNKFLIDTDGKANTYNIGFRFNL